MRFVYPFLHFFLITILCVFKTSCTTTPSPEDKVSSSENDQQEWAILFDGSNTNHWRGYNSESFPSSGWTIKDSILAFSPEESGGMAVGHNLITKEVYENFHLQLDWKIEKGSNSGIMYGVLEQEGIGMYLSGPEYQILDPDYFSEINDDTRKRITGALYDLVEPNPHPENPAGQWNHTEIIVDGPMITHQLNGKTVVEIERWTTEWFDMVRNSKFAGHNEFANARKGHIGIQDHGGTVMIKNVRIKEL